MKTGYGVYIPKQLLDDSVCIEAMKNVAEKYGPGFEEVLHSHGICSDDLKSGYVVTGCDFLMFMNEAKCFGTEKTPSLCREDGYGDMVFYYQALMPWAVPKWMPKTKEEAEKIINLFLSLLFMVKYDADFYDIE